MDLKEILKETELNFEKTISFFEQDILSVRTGRANPSLVEDVMIDSYGSKLPLKQLASISSLGPRTLLIQPWDQSMMPQIEKALSQTDLGTSPIADKDAIRITLPSLTEEYRKRILKTLSEKAEAAKVALRKSREESWRKIQESFKSGDIREDDKFKGKDDLQELIDSYTQKIDEAFKRKEKEIMES